MIFLAVITILLGLLTVYLLTPPKLYCCDLCRKRVSARANLMSWAGAGGAGGQARRILGDQGP